MEVNQASIQTSAPVRDQTLWFSVATGTVVWALHFFASYVLVDQVCRHNWLDFTTLGMNGLQFVTLLLTVIAVGITAASGVVSYQAWRKLRGGDGTETEIDTAKFSAKATALSPTRNMERETDLQAAHDRAPLAGSISEAIETANRYRFMTFSGLALSVIYIALMILTFVATFIVPPCR